MPIYFSPQSFLKAQGGGVSLSPGDPPSDKNLTAGTTSTSVTFNAPSSGSGTYSYAASLTSLRASGTPALSGSGLGAYSVTGLSNEDVVALDMTVTDTGTSKTYEQRVVISVAAAAAAGASLDPDEVSLSINSTNTSNATSGWEAGTLTFRGPVNSSGVTLGGANATSFTASGGSDGSIALAAAENLTDSGGPQSDGVYEVTATVNNEGGAGYTTATIQVTVTSDTSDLLVLATSDGYVYWRHGGGSWSADEVWASQSISTIGVATSSGTIVSLATRFDQSAAGDTLQATDLVTPSWSGSTNIGGTSYAVQKVTLDSVTGWAMLSGNNGRVYAKTLASLITDGNFGSFSTCRMNSGSDWSGGSGWAMVSRIVSQSTGRLIAVGHKGGSQNPKVSTCDNDPTGTWTQRTFGTWTSGYCFGAAATDSVVVAVGTSNTYGVLAFSVDGGETWDTTVAYNNNDFRDVSPNNDGSLWVAIGASGVICTTTDPTSVAWTFRTSGTSEDLHFVEWDNGAQEWVVGGANGTLLSSSDGITWAAETYPAGTSGAFNAAAVAVTSAPA